MHQFFRGPRAVVAAVCASVVLCGLPAGAAAAVPHASFAGTCQFGNGLVVLSPGLTVPSVRHTGQLSASGSCGAAGSFHLTGTITGVANCTGSQGAFTGSGTLTVGSTAVPVEIKFPITLPSGSFTISGMSSGSAAGVAKFANAGNLGQMPGCVGDGLKDAYFSGSFKTTSTLVSDTTTTTQSTSALTLTTATPTISGTTKAGDTLRAKSGTWTSGTRFSYQWYAGGKAIRGATRSTLKLTKADAGKTITVKVTGRLSGYVSASRTSRATRKVAS